MNADEAKQYEEWRKTKFVTMAHAYCLNKVQFLKSDASVSVKQNFDNCMTHYSNAMNVYTSQKAIFQSQLDAQRARGEDVYAHLNQGSGYEWTWGRSKIEELFKHY